MFLLFYYGLVFFLGEISKMIEVIVSLKVSDVIFFSFKDGYGYNIVMIL